MFNLKQLGTNYSSLNSNPSQRLQTCHVILVVTHDLCVVLQQVASRDTVLETHLISIVRIGTFPEFNLKKLGSNFLISKFKSEAEGADLSSHSSLTSVNGSCTETYIITFCHTQCLTLEPHHKSTFFVIYKLTRNEEKSADDSCSVCTQALTLVVDHCTSANKILVMVYSTGDQTCTVELDAVECTQCMRVLEVKVNNNGVAH